MAISSDVQICNLALQEIGQSETIQSLTESSVAAIQCNLCFEKARDGVLEDFDWNFARTYVALAPAGSAPAHWRYSYAYPAGGLCVRRLYSEDTDPEVDPKIPFEIISNGADGHLVCTDLERAQCRYTRRVTANGAFSEAFVDALVLRVAYHVCGPLTGSDRKKNDILQRYQLKLSVAERNSAGEGYMRTAAWEAGSVRARI